MELSPQQKVMACAWAILATIKEAGEEGAPSGALYTACMEFGLNYHQYQTMIELFLKKGFITQSNHVLYHKEGN